MGTILKTKLFRRICTNNTKHPTYHFPLTLTNGARTPTGDPHPRQQGEGDEGRLSCDCDSDQHSAAWTHRA